MVSRDYKYLEATGWEMNPRKIQASFLGSSDPWLVAISLPKVKDNVLIGNCLPLKRSLDLFAGEGNDRHVLGLPSLPPRARYSCLLWVQVRAGDGGPLVQTAERRPEKTRGYPQGQKGSFQTDPGGCFQASSENNQEKRLLACQRSPQDPPKPCAVTLQAGTEPF